MRIKVWQTGTQNVKSLIVLQMELYCDYRQINYDMINACVILVRKMGLSPILDFYKGGPFSLFRF